MKKTITQTLQDNKKFLKDNYLDLVYLKSLIISDNNLLLICLEEYLREYYNSDLKSFLYKNMSHESLLKLYLEMKAKEVGLIDQDKKSFNL